MKLRPTSSTTRRFPHPVSERPSAPAVPERTQRALLKACPPLMDARNPAQRLANVFRVWDKDGAGKLSLNDFHAALRQLGVKSDDLAIKALAKVGADGLGDVDYNELASQVMKGMTEPKAGLSSGITSELRLALDRLERNQEGSSTFAGAQVDPQPTHAERVLMSRVQRAAEARAQLAEVEAERRRSKESRKSASGVAPKSESPRGEGMEHASRSAVNTEKEEWRVRIKTREILNKMKTRLQASGTTTKDFLRNLETSSDIVGRAELELAISRLGLTADEKVVSQLMDELGVSPNGMQYRHAVSNMLSRLEIDYTGNGVKNGIGFLDPRRKNTGVDRAMAMTLMGQLRSTMMKSYGTVRAAFEDADANHNDELSMDEFFDFVDKYIPGVQPTVKHDAFTMLDRDSSGVIEMREFAAIVQADDNNIDKTSQAAISTMWEQQGNLTDRKTRFGATPARSYGMLLKEIMNPIPGSPAYATDEQRLKRYSAQGSLGDTIHGQCDWQAQDKALRARRQEARYRNIQDAMQRMHQTHVIDRCAREDAAYEAKLMSKLVQKERYTTSIAIENRRFLGF
mmetsp:Transcript_15421/g.43078  ORF Transcript_15421/g.43078 Transcript_15421/m.43078 type:complete len:571 (+) Transcript_15421:200-1912(+)